jgi:Protein of unknown function (DUF2958)
MELLPAELRERLPRLYSQESNSDPTVHLKFFTPDSNWTWFATEGETKDNDFLFFGYVCGFEEEWGYFVLSELSSARGPLGLPIERDLYFQPGPFREVIKRYRAERGQT